MIRLSAFGCGKLKTQSGNEGCMDLASIQSAVGGLKTAANIVSGFLKLKLTADMQTKVAELQAAILSAQSSALAANSDQFSLLEEKRRLEAKIAQLEAWEAEKQRYSLRELSPGAFAYVVKREAQGTEPVHAICTHCYQNGEKSILHWLTSHLGVVEFKCDRCEAKFVGDTNDDNFRLEAAQG
jgi:phosphatidate phosphatase APP1